MLAQDEFLKLMMEELRWSPHLSTFNSASNHVSPQRPTLPIWKLYRQLVTPRLLSLPLYDYTVNRSLGVRCIRRRELLATTISYLFNRYWVSTSILHRFFTRYSQCSPWRYHRRSVQSCKHPVLPYAAERSRVALIHRQCPPSPN